MITKKILVVDDEQSIRESLNKLLRTEGYEVALAESGQEAIEKLVQERIDLLLLDLGLPGKDGWAILRWLDHFDSPLPVIVITGRWKQAELVEAAGAEVLMEKPLNVPLLLQYIQQLLMNPAAGCAGQHHFRSVPCDTKEFCGQLWKRFTTPFPSDEPSHSKPS